MTQIWPFRGHRYDLSVVGDPSLVLTQPYDKITAEMRRRYLANSPYNVAHVIKNPHYQEAGELFNGWIREGVLRRDPQPGFYPYRQSFEHEGQSWSRTGLIGLVSLAEGEQRVKGHESVMDAPLQDRLELIRATESNDGLIFSLYSDPAQKVDRLLDFYCRKQAPVLRALDEFGTGHSLWQLSDPDAVREVQQSFDELTFYIADGHHRFQTALRYAEECRQKGWRCQAVECFDKRMMALFNLENPAVKILPTHRAVRNLTNFDSASFLERLSEDFRVEPLNDPASLAAGRSQRQPSLVLLLARPTRSYLVSCDPEELSSLSQLPPPARGLDVNLLHEGILKPLLGIGDAELKAQSHLDYFRDKQEMIGRLEAGEYQLAFLLNPTRLEQVRHVSEAGLKMPQKSTDFYPKLLTGLVFMKMEILKR